jgi:hypothetical protein
LPLPAWLTFPARNFCAAFAGSEMTISSSQLRRDFTQLAIRSAIAATARLPIEHQRRTVRSLIAFAGEIPALRRKVRRNMSMALGADVPPHAERLYFSRVGWFLANALAVFHHGAKASAVFDETSWTNRLVSSTPLSRKDEEP